MIRYLPLAALPVLAACVQAADTPPPEPADPPAPAAYMALGTEPG